MVESEKVLEAVIDDLLPSPAGNKSEESALYSITMVLNRTVSKNMWIATMQSETWRKI